MNDAMRYDACPTSSAHNLACTELCKCEGAEDTCNNVAISQDPSDDEENVDLKMTYTYNTYNIILLYNTHTVIITTMIISRYFYHLYNGAISCLWRPSWIFVTVYG